MTLGAQARLRDDYARWLTEVGANAANARNEAVRICIINSFDEALRGELCRSRYDYFPIRILCLKPKTSDAKSVLNNYHPINFNYCAVFE